MNSDRHSAGEKQLMSDMPLKFAANLSMLFSETPFIERFSMSAAAGFDACECWFPYDHLESDLIAAVRDSGIPLVGINTPPGDAAAGEWGLAALPGREQEFMEGFELALSYACRLGVPAIHVMSGVTRGIDAGEARDTLVRNLKRALVVSQSHGVTLLVEPLNPIDKPGYFVTNLSFAEKLIAEIASTRLKILFDLYHVRMMDAAPVRRLETAIDNVGHVQIASFPSRNEPDPDDHVLNDLLSKLLRRKWNGYIGCEYIPAADTRDGLAWLDRVRNRATA